MDTWQVCPTLCSPCLQTQAPPFAGQVCSDPMSWSDDEDDLDTGAQGGLQETWMVGSFRASCYGPASDLPCQPPPECPERQLCDGQLMVCTSLSRCTVKAAA